MIVVFSPIRTDHLPPLRLERREGCLIVNDQPVILPDPAGAEDREPDIADIPHLVGLTCAEGVVQATVLLPYGRHAPEAMTHPAPVEVMSDGPVAVPSDDPVTDDQLRA